MAQRVQSGPSDSPRPRQHLDQIAYSNLGPDQRRETQAFDVYLALTCGTSTNAVAGPV